MVGLMNTASQVGGLLGSLAYGYIVDRSGSFDALFIPMAALLFLGAVLWLKIDGSKEVWAEVQAEPVGAGAKAGASEPPRLCQLRRPLSSNGPS